MRRLAIASLLAVAVTDSQSRITTFDWGASDGWPVGTTVELEANGMRVSGLTGTRHTFDLPISPGDVVDARARAVPPLGALCSGGACLPSQWTTLVQTLPADPSGLWGRADGDWLTK